MARRFIRNFTIITAGLLLPAAASAQNCGLQTLSGGYAYVVVAPAVIPIEVGGLATASELGNLTFDGRGGVLGTLKRQFGRSSSGTFIETVNMAGQYTLNPDCTGTLTLNTSSFPPFISVDIAAVARGDGIVTPGALFSLSSVEWKRRASNCGLRTISGDYAFGATTTHGFPELSLPSATFTPELGAFSFDGRGGVSGTVKRLTASGPQTINLTGRYTVNADCTGSIVFDNPAEPAHDLVVAGRGSEVLSLATTTQENLLAAYTWKQK